MAAKCASHAKSEFNLATPKELFSYCGAIISLCNLLQNLAKISCIYFVLESQNRNPVERQDFFILLIFQYSLKATGFFNEY